MPIEQEGIRVVVAKTGLDGHDRGAKVVARALKDAGMIVVYTGIRRTPEEIARIVIDHNAEVLGVSIHSGAHMELLPRVIDELRKKEIFPEDLLLLVGGVIPNDDMQSLKELGFKAVFGPGTDTNDIVTFIQTNVPNFE
jgi:methylmalonyl-CoA mutase C-terminal domain/subunit